MREYVEDLAIAMSRATHEIEAAIKAARELGVPQNSMLLSQLKHAHCLLCREDEELLPSTPTEFRVDEQESFSTVTETRPSNADGRQHANSNTSANNSNNNNANAAPQPISSSDTTAIGDADPYDRRDIDAARAEAASQWARYLSTNGAGPVCSAAPISRMGVLMRGLGLHALLGERLPL